MNSNFSFFPQTGTELQHLVLTLGTHNNNNTYLKQHSMHNQREKGTETRNKRVMNSRTGTSLCGTRRWQIDCLACV
jgi:hypothetical protein